MLAASPVARGGAHGAAVMLLPASRLYNRPRRSPVRCALVPSHLLGSAAARRVPDGAPRVATSQPGGLEQAQPDLGTRGEVRGADAFRRYLTKLFASWRMHWSAREIFPLAGLDGTAVLWRATLTPLGGDVTVEVEGIDLAVIEGELLKRNEVYFDRAALLPLMASRPAA